MTFAHVYSAIKLKIRFAIRYANYTDQYSKTDSLTQWRIYQLTYKFASCIA